LSSENKLSALLGIAGMLMLIIDSETALSGTISGLELCIKTVIPALFPFFFLGSYLSSSLLGQRIPLLWPLQSLFRIPEGAESVLIPGFLGGYPSGAQCLGQTCREGSLSKECGSIMPSFLNNAGPSCLFGMVGPAFSSSMVPWVLWLIHILSALAASRFMPNAATHPVKMNRHTASVSTALRASIMAMASVCGWIILFRTLIAFLDNWFLELLPIEYRVLLTGLLELSNGCCMLKRIPNEQIRMLIASILLAAGGLCVTAQTASVVNGLSMKHYFFGKALQILFSLLLTIIFILGQWYALGISIFCILFFKKYGGNLRKARL